MTQYTDLFFAFQAKGFSLAFEDNFFMLKDSEELSDKINNVVKELVLSKSYEYIPSENRISGNIAFTIKPFPKPLAFKKVELKEIKLTKEALEKSISSTPSRVTKEMIAVHNLTSLMPSRITHLMLEFAEERAQPGHCLDLGCGTGVNSNYLLKKGWKVTAIDRNQTVLNVFNKNVMQKNKDSLNIICQDLHQFPFTPDTFDLVVIANVLNYLEPKTLVELMGKIYKTIKTNGMLIGNLCYEDKSKPNPIVAYNKAIGIHFYQKEVAASLLAHSGFEIIECRVQHEDKIEPFMIEFRAQKKASIQPVGAEREPQLSDILCCLRADSQVAPQVNHEAV